MLEINIAVTGIDRRHAALLYSLLVNFFNTHVMEYSDSDSTSNFEAKYNGTLMALSGHR